MTVHIGFAIIYSGRSQNEISSLLRGSFLSTIMLTLSKLKEIYPLNSQKFRIQNEGLKAKELFKIRSDAEKCLKNASFLQSCGAPDYKLLCYMADLMYGTTFREH